jgi:hypothetical protein
MKKIILATCFIFLVNGANCFSQNAPTTKIKNFRNSDFKVKYPKNWKLLTYNGYVVFRPKKLKEKDSTGFGRVSINPGQIKYVSNILNIEKQLVDHANTLNRHERSKSYEIIKLSDDPKFIYKIEYKVLTDYNENIYKHVEYFYLNNKKLSHYSYIIREDLFEKFHDDAMFIINSAISKN